jgi:hypothetical protein
VAFLCLCKRESVGFEGGKKGKEWRIVKLSFSGT